MKQIPTSVKGKWRKVWIKKGELMIQSTKSSPKPGGSVWAWAGMAAEGRGTLAFID